MNKGRDTLSTIPVLNTICLNITAVFYLYQLFRLVLYMLFAGTYPLTLESGYILVPAPIMLPGLRIEPHPTSTLLPRIAPIFLRPV